MKAYSFRNFISFILNDEKETFIDSPAQTKKVPLNAVIHRLRRSYEHEYQCYQPIKKDN